MLAARSTPATARSTRVDLFLCVLLCLGTIAYLTALPNNLGHTDEAFFLVEAKRVLQGDLMYRDMFWHAGPLPQWWMAGVFAVFGVSMTVARVATAALQACLAVLLYLSCRRCGVRPALALAPPLLHVAFCVGVWPFASPHWFSTLMMAAILYTLLAPGRAAHPARAMLPGLFTGALALSHQHQGAIFAVAAAALFALESVIARRSGRALPPRTWWRTVLWFALGTAIVALPIILILLATTGPTALIEQTIIHPLTGYSKYNNAVWGQLIVPSFAMYTWPALLRDAPLALLPALLRLGVGWPRRRPLAELGRLATLLLMGGAGIASIAYLPDIGHIAFIASLLFVAGAEALETLLQQFESRPVAVRAAAALIVLAVVAVLAGTTERLLRTYQLLWRNFPFHQETAFGGIDFGRQQEIGLIDAVNAVMADQPDRVLFAYPTWSHAYLAADTKNPTAHPLFGGDYLPAVEIDRTLAALATKRPLYILMLGLHDTPGDRIQAWVSEHYEVYRAETDPKFSYRLLRRRDGTPPP